MCASPGSKSAQLVEMISGGEKEPTGFVVANDADIKRAYMLVHQLLRVGMDHTIVTNHMGQDFPGLWMENTLHKCQVFDRVLCDVPCSGDGTLRKNPELWKSWHIGNSLTLHDIQVQIASRAAALLKINAIMVYSTCSMNPVENEAVNACVAYVLILIHRLLRNCCERRMEVWNWWIVVILYQSLFVDLV